MQADRGTLANLIALALAGAASLTLLMLPVYTSVRSSAVLNAGAEAEIAVTTVTHMTLLQQNGPAVLPILAVPVFIALIPLVLRRATRRLLWRIGPAILLTVLCILTGFSIGLFYIPAAIALWLSVGLDAVWASGHIT